MSKVLPKISKPGSSKFPTKGPHNPNVGTSGSGIAPRPRAAKQELIASSSASAPSQAGLARVQGSPSSPSGYAPKAGSFMPVQNNAMRNQVGQSVGQSEVAPRGNSASTAPQTSTPAVRNPIATNKPKRRGIGAAFYGEYR